MVIDTCCESVLSNLQDVRQKMTGQDGVRAILLDKASRSAYNTDSGSQGPIERINVRTDGGPPMDLSQRSDVVKSIGDFTVTRAYHDPNKSGIKRRICDIVDKEVREWKQQQPSA